jgi:beta-N-acetylhexosaminidase
VTRRVVLALAVLLATTGVVGGRAADGASRAAPPQLSLSQLAGQRVIYSYRGPKPPARLLARIRAGKAAGVIFFAGNITGRAQIRGVVATLQRAAARSPVDAPLLMMLDQEGGQVRRLGGPPTRSEKQIGASPHPVAAARAAGRGAGRNLRGVGMNVNLAPVLDVFRMTDDFIDRFERSYGRDAAEAGRLGAAFIRAQQHEGVAATAKHFPGLGAATRTQDTDQRPVRLEVPLATLRARDERPYGPAIAAGVPLVMLSWATYPALDPLHPAGLSRTIVRQELRGRLGFKGVTVTDALGAGALRAFGGTPDRAVLAATAGMDLLLCASQDVGEGDAAAAGLVEAARHGQLDLRAAANRVIQLRRAMS